MPGSVASGGENGIHTTPCLRIGDHRGRWLLEAGADINCVAIDTFPAYLGDMEHNYSLHQIIQQLSIWDVVMIVLAIGTSRLLASGIRWGMTALAGQTSPPWRIRILSWMPIFRLCIALTSVAFIIWIVIVPSWQNVVALLAGAGLVLSFALKDYGSCLLAGLATIFERIYRPGDWIEIQGAYGEVRSIGMRAVHLVTLDDTEVIVPHAAIWASPVFNATSGLHTVQCAADFYLHPEHDGLLVRERLAEIASTSPFLLPDSSITVIAAEQPWGTHYRLKAYAKDSREQKLFTTDLTLRSKKAFKDLGIKPALATAAATA